MIGIAALVALCGGILSKSYPQLFFKNNKDTILSWIVYGVIFLSLMYILGNIVLSLLNT